MPGLSSALSQDINNQHSLCENSTWTFASFESLDTFNVILAILSAFMFTKYGKISRIGIQWVGESRSAVTPVKAGVCRFVLR